MGNRDTSKRVVYTTSSSYYANNTKLTTPFVLLKRRIASDNPHYKSNIRENISATNSYAGFYDSCHYKSGVTSHVCKFAPYQNVKQRQTTNGFRPKNPDTLVIDKGAVLEANNKAAVAIRSKIQAELESINGIAFVGEILQARKEIKHLALSAIKRLHTNAPKLNNFGRQMVKRNKNGRYIKQDGSWAYVKETRDRFSDLWLETNFALSPTIGDIGKIAYELNQSIPEVLVHSLRAAGTGSREIYTPTQSNVNSTTRQKGQILTKTTASTYTVVGVKAENALPRNAIGYLPTLEAKLGLGARSVVPAIQELLPWSFFIEYFINVGDIISAGCMSTNNVVWASTTTVAEVVESWWEVYLEPTNNSQTRDWALESKPVLLLKKKRINRTAGLIPFPELTFSLPGVRAGLNIAALSNSLFK